MRKDKEKVILIKVVKLIADSFLYIGVLSNIPPVEAVATATSVQYCHE